MSPTEADSKSMEISPKQQALDLLRSAKKVWIMSHKSPDGDAVGSSLALARVLEKLDKQVEVAAWGGVPEQMRFLQSWQQLHDNLHARHETRISLPLQSGEHAQLLYARNQLSGALEIVVKTEREMAANQVAVTVATELPDVLVILDSSTLEHLGPLAEQVRPLLSQIKTIAIDHHASHQPYAQVTWLETGATSTSEIMVGLIEAMAGKTPLFDAEIATSLLLGLMTDTGSFQNENTTPKSLTTAAQLVALGADRELIVKCVFRTKSFGRLKLWGRALEHLQVHQSGRFAWTSLAALDFQQTKTTEEDASGLIDELLKSLPNVRFALVLSERQLGLQGSMRSVDDQTDVSRLAERLGGGGHKKAAGFLLLGASLTSKQDEILQTLAA